MLIIGTSYKEDTSVIDHSFGAKIISNFYKKLEISVFDFLEQKFLKKKKYNINYYNEIESIDLKKVDLIIITHNDRRLLKYKRKFLSIKHLYDPWDLIS